ncbi:hypothetical protein PanWU01x14_291410, partial [Parasponia andersonii]
ILKNWSLNLKQPREVVIRKHIITIRNQDRKISLTDFSFTTTPSKPSDAFNNISRRGGKKKKKKKLRKKDPKFVKIYRAAPQKGQNLKGVTIRSQKRQRGERESSAGEGGGRE